MKQLKRCETTRLHYRKYLYKLSLYNDLAPIFRTELQSNNLNHAKVTLDKLNHDYEQGLPLKRQTWRTEISLDVFTFLDAKDIYGILRLENDYIVRIERGRMMSIYSNNKNMFIKIMSKLRSTPCEFWEPDKKLIPLLEKKENIRLVDKNPSLKYQVFINSKPIDPNFGKWLDANKDKSKVGKRALGYIKSGWASDCYFYVRDEKVLAIVELLIGHNIRRIDKLVYKENIDKY